MGTWHGFERVVGRRRGLWRRCPHVQDEIEGVLTAAARREPQRERRGRPCYWLQSCMCARDLKKAGEKPMRLALADLGGLGDDAARPAALDARLVRRRVAESVVRVPLSS